MPKRIRDPLYGFIEVPDNFLPIIDHPLVQRLRWVSQLPLEQLVYPSAQHSRFEHSLGVMHLARKAARALVENSTPLFKQLAKKDNQLRGIAPKKRPEVFMECAALIGLLHDVGHAPFSHTLEDACNYFGQKEFAYDHEKVGLLLAKNILAKSDFGHGVVGKVAVRVLNKANKRADLNPIEGLLRDIVDGSIDVDKGTMFGGTATIAALFTAYMTPTDSGTILLALKQIVLG